MPRRRREAGSSPMARMPPSPSLSRCRIRLPQGEEYTPVMLGEKEDEALLGTVTLEEFGLVLNPLTRKLQPMRMMLA